MSVPFHAPRLLALVVLALILAACDSDSEPSSDGPEGLYLMSSVNGAALPYSFDNEQGTTTLQAASIALEESGSIEWVLEYTFQRPGQPTAVPVTEEATGTWQLSDDELEVTWVEFGPTFFSPSVSRGSIDLTINWFPDIDLALHFER